MIIQRTRIRNLERHLPDRLRGTQLRLGIADANLHSARMQRAGFCEAPSPGDRVLPSRVGPVTRYNAEGKELVRRDQPKETAYRLVEWHWKEWHGKDQVERSDFKNVPYERYPREFMPPPSVSLEAVQNDTGQLLIVTDPLLYEGAGSKYLLHAINVCLELFGQCEVFEPCLTPVAPVPTHYLNWQVLPPGQHPWPKLQTILAPIVAKAKRGHQNAITMRLEKINARDPEFVAVGQAGFHGYLIFGFPTKSLFILESAYYGNATYVFESNWEALSQLTKADILNHCLQKDRLIHIEGWENHLARLFYNYTPHTMKPDQA